MKKILIPYDVADECFLLEALYWVAFKVYPIEVCGGRRDNNYYIDDNTSLPERPDSCEYIDYFTKDKCLELGLSPCPAMEFFEQCEDFPPDLERSKQMFELLKKNPDIDKEILDRVKNDYNLALEWANKQSVWEEEKNAFLESSKSQLFLALKNNKIRSFGVKHAMLQKNVSSHNWRKKNIWDYDENNWESDENTDEDGICAYNFSKIPRGFWRTEGIEWDASRASSPMGEYIHILLNTEDLLREFPEPQSIITTVKSIAGSFVLDGNDDMKPCQKFNNSRGRPSHDWDSFYPALIKVLLKKPLPAKLENLVEDMGDWCVSNWGHRPARSTLIQKIAPIFNSFKSQNHS